MDVAKLFLKRPPIEPLTSLDAILRDWQMRTAPGGGLDLRRDAVVEYCRSASTFRDAVNRAVRSRDANGKHHNHQSKVKLPARLEFGALILLQMYNMNRKGIGFDRLHDELDRIRPKGVGPVTTYDVAVRIGAYLGIEPQSLYLHAGVRAGWVALCPSWARSGASGVVERIPRSEWPAALRKMRADDLEDFLCTYRTIFTSVCS